LGAHPSFENKYCPVVALLKKRNSADFSFTPRFSEVTPGDKFDPSRFNGFSSETLKRLLMVTLPAFHLAEARCE